MPCTLLLVIDSMHSGWGKGTGAHTCPSTACGCAVALATLQGVDLPGGSTPLLKHREETEHQVAHEGFVEFGERAGECVEALAALPGGGGAAGLAGAPAHAAAVRRARQAVLEGSQALALAMVKKVRWCEAHPSRQHGLVVPGMPDGSMGAGQHSAS